ncbi:unnamed protein product [Linum tenue]|uniref:Uncharacterized protein n=1 Tax=Linum tenue TaxID=586396 RepID=A0AAV0QW16_9ROSI|nr:unnamed protein product [Linum tenue]
MGKGGRSKFAGPHQDSRFSGREVAGILRPVFSRLLPQNLRGKVFRGAAAVGVPSREVPDAIRRSFSAPDLPKEPDPAILSSTWPCCFPVQSSDVGCQYGVGYVVQLLEDQVFGG